MQFLGSVRMDGSKRITLIKEVAEILEVSGQDYLKFYIENGEIIIRRVLPENNDFGFNNAEFWEWARKRQIEIDMADPEKAELMQKELDEKIDSMHDLEDGIKKMQTFGE